MTAIQNLLRPKIVAICALCCGVAVIRANGAQTGWFLNGEVGPSFVNDMSLVSTTQLTPEPEPRFQRITTRLSFKTGVRVDLNGGYQFDDSWALELEGGFICNSVDFSNSGQAAARSLYQIPLLLNGIYTLPVKWPVKPYVGAGLGGELTGLNGFHDSAGAGQLMAGLKFQMSPRINLGLGYKLLVTTKHDWSNFFDASQTGRTINNSLLANITVRF
jgi:opacity protein-like surface antigen